MTTKIGKTLWFRILASKYNRLTGLITYKSLPCLSEKAFYKVRVTLRIDLRPVNEMLTSSNSFEQDLNLVNGM